MGPFILDYVGKREILLMSSRAFGLFFFLRNEMTYILQKHSNIITKTMMLSIEEQMGLKRSTDDQR